MSSAPRRLYGLFTANNAAAAKTATIESATFGKLIKKFKAPPESNQFRSGRDVHINTVRRLAKARKLSALKDLLKYQKTFKHIADEPFTSRLIMFYGKAGMFGHARKMFDEMPELNCPRTVHSFNALLSACVDAGEYDKIQEIVSDLPDELGIKLDVVSYNIIIKGFYKMRALDSAADVFDRMIKEGISPNSTTFNTLLFGFYCNGRFAEGDMVWGKMEEMDVVPNTRSYNAKLYGLALDKRMKDAVELVKEMKRKNTYPDLYSYHSLIRGFVADDDLEEAKYWYGEMRKNDYTIDRITLEKFVGFVCEKGDFSFACVICEENLRIRNAALLQLVADGLVKDSKTEDAEKLLQLRKRKNKAIKPKPNQE